MVNIEFTNKIGTFKKIPKEIIYQYEDFNNNKRILLFLYIQYATQTDMKDEKNFTFDLSNLLHWCSLNPNRHKGGVNDQFVSMLQMMEEKKYIQKNLSYFGKLENYHMVEDFFNPRKNYGMIYNFEVDHILTAYKNKEILGKNAHYNLLLVLCYLRSNMTKLSRAQAFNLETREKNPQVCWRYFKTISEDLGLTESTVSECVNTLNKMGIIAYHQLKREKKTDFNGWKNLPTVFANKYQFDSKQKLITSYSWERELKAGEQKIRNNQKRRKF